MEYAGKAIAIEKLTVRADRIVAEVRVSPHFAYTTPEVAQRALSARPNLGRHACVNEKGPTFDAVIQHTPLPHLFEHVVVDILCAGAQDATHVVTGTSEWTNRASGKARVEVSYTDDLEALAALKEAEKFLNKMTSS